MSKEENAQKFAAKTVNELKQIKKELEKASKMHASQADRVGKML